MSTGTQRYSFIADQVVIKDKEFLSQLEALLHDTYEYEKLTELKKTVDESIEEKENELRQLLGMRQLITNRIWALNAKDTSETVIKEGKVRI
jgi:hypothetical protein